MKLKFSEILFSIITVIIGFALIIGIRCLLIVGAVSLCNIAEEDTTTSCTCSYCENVK